MLTTTRWCTNSCTPAAVLLALVAASAMHQYSEARAREEEAPARKRGVSWACGNELRSRHVNQAMLDAARHELGMDPGERYPDDGLLSHTKHWYSFWHFIEPRCTVAGTHGRCALYVPTVGVATEAIRKALLDGMFRIQATVERNYITLDRVSCYAEGMRAVGSQQFHLPNIREMCYTGIYVFTFIREPLRHFVAGYNEFIKLEYGDAAHLEPGALRRIRRAIALDGNTPADVVESFASGNVHWPHPTATQMALMSGTVYNSFGTLDLVGTVENASANWRQMLHDSDILAKELWSYMPAPQNLDHTDVLVDDPFHAGDGMLTLLSTNTTLRRAVCKLLAPDYGCFAYDIKHCIDGTALSNRSPR